MTSTNTSGILSSTQEGQLILQATEQILASFATPLTLNTWPLYVFEAVSIVYSGVEMSMVNRKGVVESILQNLVNSSTVLTAAEKSQLNAIIAQTTSAAVDALLKANSVVETWIETESRTCWTRFKSWWMRHGCCCGDGARDDVPAIAVPVVTQAGNSSRRVSITPISMVPVTQATTIVPEIELSEKDQPPTNPHPPLIPSTIAEEPFVPSAYTNSPEGRRARLTSLALPPQERITITEPRPDVAQYHNP